MGEPTPTDGSVSSAAASSPRRWCPRARSSRPRSATRGPTRRSAPSSTTLLRDYAGRPSPLTECKNLGARLGVRRAAEARGPQPHRLAQDQQRPRAGAARAADGQGARSSPRPAPASTASPPRRRPRCSGWSAASTWARSTSSARRSTCSACGCSVPRSTPVTSGSRTLKDAVNEAMRDWVASVESTHYCLGSVMGPHPYPWMVREFHRVIGDEARAQCEALLGGASRRRRRVCRRRVERGRHLLRLRRHRSAVLVGVEPAGGAAIGHGVPGVVHGMKSLPACRTSTARCSRRTRSRPASTIPASGPSTRTSRRSAGRATSP